MFGFGKTNHKSIARVELIIDPSNWGALISAVKVLVEHDGGVDSVGTPSFTTLIKKIFRSTCNCKKDTRK